MNEVTCVLFTIVVDVSFNGLLTGVYTEKFLKTRKIREAEEAERRSRITKVLLYWVLICSNNFL